MDCALAVQGGGQAAPRSPGPSEGRLEDVPAHPPLDAQAQVSARVLACACCLGVSGVVALLLGCAHVRGVVRKLRCGWR